MRPRSAAVISAGRASSHSRAVTALPRRSAASAAFHSIARSRAQAGASRGAAMNVSSTPDLQV